MNTQDLHTRQEHLRKWSQDFPYPATPDIAGSIARHLQGEARFAQPLRPRLAWGIIALVFLLGVLMAVPTVRAQVLEFLQIGAIRIFLVEPTPTAAHVFTQTPVQAGQPESPTASATPSPSPGVYPSISELAGETSLAEARSQLDFPIWLPTYPSDLGQPDRVFLQDLGGQSVLLVWMDPAEPDRIRLNLLLMGPGTFAEKVTSSVIEETTVNGQRAIWTEGPHLLHLGGSIHDYVPLVVKGNVLIWGEEEVTYRLETDLPLDEAVRVAESLATDQPLVESGKSVASPATPITRDQSLENCPVTKPQEPPFTPPPPYPPEAPYAGYFWYGTEALWTMLSSDGTWRGLPYHAEGGGHYVQKVFWWNEDYDWQAEPWPEFMVTARRLDASAPDFASSEATNAFHPDFGSAMLTGVEIPTSGCWEFTGSYRGQSLSFVVWVAP